MGLSTITGLAIVIMGVSGSGKSTVAESLANAIGCKFVEADDFHPPSNKEKMKAGIPLSESDRIPWLETLRDAIKENIEHGHNVTLSCSALQKRYRETLRSADCDYKPGNYSLCKVKFVCLEAPVEILMERMKRRSEEGSHFMPSCLLESQLDLLQLEKDEAIIRVDATMELESILEFIIDLLNRNWNL
ncbi:P-loop containing nucleoside triphosphate hydrolases superfamily protein isoform X2 [Carex rostrata]